MAISYKDSGVDVTRGYKAVELMKKHVKSTYNDNVIGDRRKHERACFGCGYGRGRYET